MVAVGPGGRDRDGKHIPVNLKEGDTVLLPEYGGTEVKLGEKELVFFHFFIYYFYFSHLSLLSWIADGITPRSS